MDTDSLNRICSGVLRVNPSPSKQDGRHADVGVEAVAGGDLQAELLPVAEEAERMENTAAQRQREREPRAKRKSTTALEDVLRLMHTQPLPPSKQDGAPVDVGTEAAAGVDQQAELLPVAEEAERMNITAARRQQERQGRPKRKRMTALEIVERWQRVSGAGQEVLFDFDTCKYLYKY